jgi:hypothetical protein
MAQYPHIVKITTSGASTLNSNGDYTGAASSTLEMSGRYEASSGNALITAQDGTMVSYSGIVYIPYPLNPVSLGSVVEVYNSRDHLVAKGTVKLYLEGEVIKKNARLWL